MSDVVLPNSVDTDTPEEPEGVIEGSIWRRLDSHFERLGDYVNPILVKETRQALKSRQFTVTFTIVLFLAWVFTVFVTAFQGPMVHVRPSGTDVFIWFYVALLLPLILIVPFFAFRSLISENEDNTYDLLSITTLTPRQIISGKLGSSLIQIVVYMSALAPCLTFTYLLRGIDVLTIGAILFYTFCASLGLSVICLFLATVTRDKIGQLFLSVLVIVGLCFVFAFGIAIVGNLMFSGFGGSDLNSDEFWITSAALLTFYLTTFVMVFLAAAARLTFASENRSTALRVAMVVWYLAIVAWMSILWQEERWDYDVLKGFLACAGIFWFAMGALMTGEEPIFSRRVMRSLPQSFLGRTLFTWFNPGPGTGYAFSVVNTLSAVVLVALGLMFGEFLGVSGRGGSMGDPGAILAGGLALVCYMIIFLGIGKLIVGWLGRLMGRNMAIPLLVHIMMLLVASLVPLAIQYAMVGDVNDYNLLHITDPFWTFVELVDGATTLAEAPVILVVLPVCALIVLLCNWRGLSQELSFHRISRPERLIEEDKENAPVIEPVRVSPWDEGTA